MVLLRLIAELCKAFENECINRTPARLSAKRQFGPKPSFGPLAADRPIESVWQPSEFRAMMQPVSLQGSGNGQRVQFVHR